MMTSSPTRRLILLRHAKSAWPDVPDHERPLAPRGRRDAPAAGRWLVESGHVPDLVVCSTARRARETWQLAEEELEAWPAREAEKAEKAGKAGKGRDIRPRTVFEPRAYGATAAELADLARETPADVSTLMIVGHEPSMRDLTLDLVGASRGRGDGEALERVTAKFPTAAIAVLALTGRWPDLGPGLARLAGFVVPGDLRSGHRGRG